MGKLGEETSEGCVIHFTVPGKPMGYYAVGRSPNWKRMRAYHDYCERVRWAATSLGVKLPLHSTNDRPLLIRVMPYFATGIHCDPGNVQKGICDALFYSRTVKASDKYTGGSFPPPLYDKKNPRVEVMILERHEFEIPMFGI